MIDSKRLVEMKQQLAKMQKELSDLSVEAESTYDFNQMEIAEDSVIEAVKAISRVLQTKSKLTKR